MPAETMSVLLAADAPGIGKEGERVMLALTPSDVHTSEELDTYLAGFSPFEFRADEVSPPNPLIVKENDTFRTFSKNNAFRRADVESSTREDVKTVDPESSTEPYRTVERALGSFIPERTEAQSGTLYDVKEESLQLILWKIALDREIRLWELLEATANWDANNTVTLSGGTRWDQATANPIADLQARMNASNQEVTDIWMPPTVSQAFLRHQTTRDHMRQMLGDNPVDPNVGEGAGASKRVDYQITGMPVIHVVPGKVLNETTDLVDEIMTDSVVLTTGGQGFPRGGRNITTLQTFRESGPNGTGFTSREFFVDKAGLHGGTMVVAGHSEDIVFTANTVGGLVSDVLT